MAKIKESNLRLNASRENINKEELQQLMEEYYMLLKEYPVKIDTDCGFTDVIKLVKRNTDKQIGPYVNITLFEALNRIASDLVILHGLNGLIEADHESKVAKMTIYLGNENSANGDFEIEGKHGEAFNVAPSFFAGKMRQTKTKWERSNDEKEPKNEKLHYIFYNGELGANDKIGKYLSSLSGNFYAKALVGVNSWNKGLEGQESITIKKL